MGYKAGAGGVNKGNKAKREDWLGQSSRLIFPPPVQIWLISGPKSNAIIGKLSCANDWS